MSCSGDGMGKACCYSPSAADALGDACNRIVKNESKEPWEQYCDAIAPIPKIGKDLDKIVKRCRHKHAEALLKTQKYSLQKSQLANLKNVMEIHFVNRKIHHQLRNHLLDQVMISKSKIFER